MSSVAPGSNSIRLIIAPSPKSGCPVTPGASSNERRSVSLTNCGFTLRSSPHGMSERKEYRVAGQAEPISHYTDAVRAGDLLFVSGCVPVDADGRLVGGDAVAQARQVFSNVGAAREAGGASFADVVNVTVYLLDIDDRPRTNPVRR